MGRDFTPQPWMGDSGWCSHQLNQCRIHIDKRRTVEFCADLPRISDNCQCGNCAHFESVVIKQPNSFFDLMTSMGIDTSRQLNESSGEICCLGETKPGRTAYMGTYTAYGQIGKTSKSTVDLDDEGKINAVHFNDAEFGESTTATITKADQDRLEFSFYIEVDTPEGY